MKKEEYKKIEKVPIPPKENDFFFKNKSFKIPPLAWFVLIWVTFAFIGVWLKTNVNFTVDKGMIIATASISIMANIAIIGAVFATGIGLKIVKRFKNRILFHTGRYVNTIYLTKNGTGKEVFKRVDPDTKTFNVLGQKFIRNPKLLFNFEKIPTYIHREGNPDPLNVWDDKLASDFSNSEMDIAMTSAQNFDLKQWINTNKMYILIVAVIIIGLAAASVFFGAQLYAMLRDGTYKAVECILPPNMIIPGV